MKACCAESVTECIQAAKPDDSTKPRDSFSQDSLLSESRPWGEEALGQAFQRVRLQMLGTMTGDGHLPVHEAYSPEACVPASLGSRGRVSLCPPLSRPVPTVLSIYLPTSDTRLALLSTFWPTLIAQLRHSPFFPE